MFQGSITTTSNSSSKASQGSTSSSGMRRLPRGFKPGPQDVICQRGRAAFLHNQNFRNLAETFVDRYSNAISRLDKSTVVSEVIELVRKGSPDGGFIRLGGDGFYYEVGDSIAREKCGGTFREFLHSKYRSTTKSKRKIRQQRKCQHPKVPEFIEIPTITEEVEAEQVPSKDHNSLSLITSSSPKSQKTLCLNDLLQDISARKQELSSKPLASFSALDVFAVRPDKVLSGISLANQHSQRLEALMSLTCGFPKCLPLKKTDYQTQRCLPSEHNLE